MARPLSSHCPLGGADAGAQTGLEADDGLRDWRAAQQELYGSSSGGGGGGRPDVLRRRAAYQKQRSTKPQTLALANIFGSNRTGLVRDFASVVHELNGSLRETRMCRMGGIFSLLAMVALPADALPKLQRRLTDQLDQRAQAGPGGGGQPAPLPTVVDVRATQVRCLWLEPGTF
eukprot:SAG22_NODE_878_length_6715_cov_9.368652_5_plen_174_part_00